MPSREDAHERVRWKKPSIRSSACGSQAHRSEAPPRWVLSHGSDGGVPLRWVRKAEPADEPPLSSKVGRGVPAEPTPEPRLQPAGPGLGPANRRESRTSDGHEGDCENGPVPLGSLLRLELGHQTFRSRPEQVGSQRLHRPHLPDVSAGGKRRFSAAGGLELPPLS
jgi:hypothetical protein